MGAAQLMTSSNQQQESLKLQMFHYGFPVNEFRAHKSVPSSSQEMNSQLTKKCSTMLPKKWTHWFSKNETHSHFTVQ
jgi:hypothetical protein